MVKRFGQGILLLLPKSLPDEILRAMHDSIFEDLLTMMDSILSQSAVLLRSATALSNSLIRGQAPAKIPRPEVDDTILDPDTEYSRQELDGLLEPCGVITSLENSNEGTLQVQESSRSLSLGTTLSPVWSTRISRIREGRSTDRRSLEFSAANVSDLLPPAKCSLSTISSHLGSPSHSPLRSGSITTSQESPWSDFTSFRSPGAGFSDLLSPGKSRISAVPSSLLHSPRLPTPAASHNAWVATDLRTPSLISPVW
ncbi:hypothetical protein N7G274_010062 [Stereocaulon virgatum]|uniref:Uncharacterized protein n=1 Tax=Stereocaulon virgatum TaxID=373712 RepID=A0ABR3ZUE1_9LECA